jgi:hypothetical protein
VATEIGLLTSLQWVQVKCGAAHLAVMVIRIPAAKNVDLWMWLRLVGACPSLSHGLSI